MLLAMVCVCGPAGAQERRGVSVGAAAGVGYRGAGNTGACCGPFGGDLRMTASPWVMAGIGHRVSSRLAVEAAFDWTRQPAHVAFVQGAFAGPAVRGYEAATRQHAITGAGIFRVHGAARIEIVGGAGVPRERSASHLESVVFRPTLIAEPQISMDLNNTRAGVTAVTF